MPATGNTATRGKIKVLITALLLIGLMVGLAACRGFFGQAPIALFTYTSPTDTEVPVTITFDISASSDPDGAIVSYDLDYGDTSPHATGTDVTDVLTHTYNAAGPFTVTLTVTDGDGRIGKISKTIGNIGPMMITFASDRGGDYDIWRMHADGTDEGIVLNTLGDDLFPDLVRGTRDKIAYSTEDSVSWNLSTMTVLGVGIATLTNQTASNQIQPSWSSNQLKIAYASNAAQTPSDTTWKIYTMVPTGAVDSGTVLSAITQTPSWAPAYSPVDANTLLYVSTAGNSGDGTTIWKYNGSTTTKLIPAADDGKHYGDASPVISLRTAAPALDLPTNAGISKPAWSLDGTKIAFSTNQGASIDIYVMNANGTAVQTLEAYVNSLLSSPVTTGLISSPTYDEFSPYWLEDESGLVFAREEVTGYNIYKVSFDDGSVTQLTDTTGNDIMPAAKR